MLSLHSRYNRIAVDIVIKVIAILCPGFWNCDWSFAAVSSVNTKLFALECHAV